MASCLMTVRRDWTQAFEGSDRGALGEPTTPPPTFKIAAPICAFPLSACLYVAQSKISVDSLYCMYMQHRSSETETPHPFYKQISLTADSLCTAVR